MDTIKQVWAYQTRQSLSTRYVTTLGLDKQRIGRSWLEQVFDRDKNKARPSYRLLIPDGHESHVTMDFIEYCDQNKILVTIFPCSTHTLQPLMCIFKPLLTAHSNELSAFPWEAKGLSPTKKGALFALLWRPGWDPSRKRIYSTPSWLGVYHPSTQTLYSKRSSTPSTPT